MKKDAGTEKEGQHSHVPQRTFQLHSEVNKDKKNNALHSEAIRTQEKIKCKT